MLRNDEYEIIKKDVLSKIMVVKRGIRPGEEIDLSSYQQSIIIQGSIGDGATVNTAYNLTVEGDIGKKCIVSANQGSVIAKNIGDESSIKAGRSIGVCTVGQGVMLEARDHIEGLDIGSNCKLISNKGQVRTGNVGDNTLINAFYQAFTKNVGEHAKITSEKSDVYVGHILSDVEIIADSNIYFISMKNNTTLTPKNGQLMVQLDSNGNAFGPYIPPTPATTPTLKHQQPLEEKTATSINLINANLSTLSIEVPLNLDLGNLSASIATFFAVEKKPGENIFTVKSDKDGTTYNIEKRTSPR